MKHQPGDGDRSGKSERVRRFEEAFARAAGRRSAVAVNSGTSAILAALHAVSVRRGEPVLTPAVAPVMTALPVLTLGAYPVFYDCGPDNLAPDPASLRERLARVPGIRVLITMPGWGYPWSPLTVRTVCQEYGLVWIEDAAQAQGTLWDGRWHGSFADIAAYSLHERKPISAGEGGVLVTDDRRLAKCARSFVFYGARSERDFRGPLAFGHSPGLNLKFNADGADAASEALASWPARHALRKVLIEHLHVQSAELTPVPWDPEGTPNGYAFLARVREPSDLGQARDRARALGVPCEIEAYRTRALFRYPLFERWSEDCPNAERFLATVMALPAHDELDEEDVRRIVALVRGAPT